MNERGMRNTGRAACSRAWGRFIVVLVALCPLLAAAHIGDPNVFFEGQAGPYPVRVVIRPPGVIPGLAEISVRVETNGVQRVTALPMRWNTGRAGAPPADVAQPVRGESNLYSAELWFMKSGAESVEITVTGAAGVGHVIVPVNAVATRVLGLSRSLGAVLAGLGLLLVALAVSIVGAAVRESVLPGGETPGRKRRWLARGLTIGAAVAVGGLLWFGKNWWASEAGDYRNNRLYQPVEVATQIRVENGRRILTIDRAPKGLRNNGPLVPEHGKLMHLFLIREPQMDAFAHLHPLRINWKTFDAPLPDLPAGDYRVYADVTYETGFADTLIAKVNLPAPSVETTTSTRPADVDDGWMVSSPFARSTNAGPQRVALPSSMWMDVTMDAPPVENRDTNLRFKVRDVILRPVMLEHYMGMAGHLILRRADGAVFTHLHPGGSFSMAAQQLFELRAEGKAPQRVASAKDDPICKLLLTGMATNSAMTHQEISFPYAFPKAGDYRLWMQVKVKGEVLTGVFDVRVAPAMGESYATAEKR